MFSAIPGNRIIFKCTNYMKQPIVKESINKANFDCGYMKTFSCDFTDEINLSVDVVDNGDFKAGLPNGLFTNVKLSLMSNDGSHYTSVNFNSFQALYNSVVKIKEQLDKIDPNIG